VNTVLLNKARSVLVVVEVALALKAPIEMALRDATGGLPVARVRSMHEVVVQSTARQDFNMLLLTVFGFAALLLAAIGVYGLTDGGFSSGTGRAAGCVESREACGPASTRL